jgi:ubiquinone/menaquinone biosynthesis C-methylase UbiE
MSTEELSNTYVVQNQSNLEEMHRLEIQDKIVTKGLGGVLPELTAPEHLRWVLDVGCGTGGWLIETAKQYPTIEKLIGVDISSKMVEYARAQAESAGLGERVQFQVMDALRILEFPDARFDLVNHRYGISWLRTWEWKKLLVEYQRVCRPSGIIRITEPDNLECNTPALTTLFTILARAFYHSGRFFDLNKGGAAGDLAGLLRRHAIENVQTRVHSLVYRAGTQECQHFSDDIARVFRLFLPFLRKWTRVPDDYEEIYQQALREMRQPDFVATWTYLTVWGTHPSVGITMRRDLP